MTASDKINKLVHLAQERGYLTYSQVNAVCSDDLTSPEEMDEIVLQLRRLEIEILDDAKIERNDLT